MIVQPYEEYELTTDRGVYNFNPNEKYNAIVTTNKCKCDIRYIIWNNKNQCIIKSKKLFNEIFRVIRL